MINTITAIIAKPVSGTNHATIINEIVVLFLTAPWNMEENVALLIRGDKKPAYCNKPERTAGINVSIASLANKEISIGAFKIAAKIKIGNKIK